MARQHKLKKISSQLNRDLLIVMLGMFLLTSVLSIIMQYRSALEKTEQLLKISLEDEISSISREVDMYLEYELSNMSMYYSRNSQISIDLFADLFNIEELNILDRDGIVTKSTNSDLIGFDFKSEPETAKIIQEIASSGAVVSEIRPSVNDPYQYCKYVTVEIVGSTDQTAAYIEAGYSEDYVSEVIGKLIQETAANRHILEHGMIFVFNEERKVVSHRSDLIHEDPDMMAAMPETDGAAGQLIKANYSGRSYYQMYNDYANYRIIALLPKQEVLSDFRMSLLMTVVLGAVILLTLFFGILLLVRQKVVRQVNALAKTLGAITDGDLDAKADVRSSVEFDLISDGINAMVGTMKEHIAAEAARIDDELYYAQEIQHSSLPALIEPYVRNRFFSLDASMKTARAVGGDFYDFYMLDEMTLAFVIADVSGKGIPAAMFMMNGKAKLHDCIRHADVLGAEITEANRLICEGNEAGMFITAWVGTLDLRTGEMHFVNAGHNPPLLLRNGKAELLETESNLLLGLMDDEEYRMQTMHLQKGDILYLYTDGVTEAVNAEQELFGEKRLLASLDGVLPEGEDICRSVNRNVQQAVSLFAERTPQADDITMLCLHYKGAEEHDEQQDRNADG